MPDAWLCDTIELNELPVSTIFLPIWEIEPLNQYVFMYNTETALLRRPDTINEKLYVITPVFNPHGWRTRWKHAMNFSDYVVRSGAHLVLIEATFGEHPNLFIEQRSENCTIIHVGVTDELWLKESLINLAVTHLPKDAKYLATIDADMTFANPTWVIDTIHQLQHTPVVQMFSEVIYLSPDYEKHSDAISFMEGWKGRGIPWQTNGQMAKDDTYYKRNATKEKEFYGKQNGWTGAPGGAWAYTRKAFNDLGGLLDFAILGSADHYMALGLFGIVDNVLRDDFSPEYRQMVFNWQENAVRAINRNVGYVYGVMLHYWHGKLTNRQYGNRNDILVRNKYNPLTDIKKDINGLWQLNPEKWQLRDDLKSYFKIRNEDSVDL